MRIRVATELHKVLNATKKVKTLDLCITINKIGPFQQEGNGDVINCELE